LQHKPVKPRLNIKATISILTNYTSATV